MQIFAAIEEQGHHEQVVFASDRETGLRMIIGVHDTTLGPALGGCRLWPYASEEEALRDVLRLSRAMTLKNAVQGLNLGGGKAVVIIDPSRPKSEALMRAIGRAVDRLGGRYITAEDVGTNSQDMAVVRSQTRYVAGLPDTSGDPSPATAFGVFRGMLAVAKAVWGLESLEGRRVAIQGVGSVGYHLARHLHQAGARLVVTDLRPERVQRCVEQFGAVAVEPDKIYDVECDIFAPCGLGGSINDETIPRLRCRAVAGSANNQLAEDGHGEELRRRGIVYAPDFVINGGGVINVANEFEPGGYNAERAMAQVAAIYDRVAKVLEIAEQRGIPTSSAAIALAEERLAKARRKKALAASRA